MDDLLREFLTETSESLDTVDNQLVKFEQEPNNAKILDNIFRLVHTIKGTCGFLGLPRLEALAHAGETLMSKFRDGMPVTAGAVTVILSSIDRIKEILAGLEATEAEPEGNDRDLIDKLEAMVEQGMAAMAAGAVADAPPLVPEAPTPVEAKVAPSKEKEMTEGTLIDQTLERPLRPGEVSLDELERAFRETPAKEMTQGSLIDQTLERPLRPGEVSLDELERAFRETAIEAPAPVAKAEPAPAAEAPALAAKEAAKPAKEKAAPKKSMADEGAGEGDSIANQSIRVNVDTLEHLMTMVSELVLTRNQLLEISRRNEDTEFKVPLQRLSNVTAELQEGVMKTRMQPILTRNQLLEISRRNEDTEFKVPLQRLSNVTAELQEGVMKTRMQPIGNAWQKLPRIVRDLSSELGKQIELEMHGADTELDRQVLDLIKDPLTHMVRNSADHGLETPAERLASGKGEQGTIRLSAYHEGGHIIICIADNGRGLNTERIKAKAISSGLVTEAELEKMSEAQIHKFIFAPGFSTAAPLRKGEQGTIRLSAYHEGGHIIICIADNGRGLNTERIKAKAISSGLVTEAELEKMSEAQIHKFIFAPGFSTAAAITSVSGRGVGMDVVRTNIDQIGGTIDIKSVADEGSSVTIKIPLTLAIVSALIVEAAGDRFAIPQLSVVELVRARANSEHRIERIKDTAVLRLRNKLLPLIHLKKLLKIDDGAASDPENGFIVVTQVGSQTFGIVVDGVFHTEEIVVKPMSTKLRHIDMFSGNTILGDGAVIMIIDPNGIAKALGAAGSSAHDMGDENGAHHIGSGEQTTSLLVFRAGSSQPKADVDEAASHRHVLRQHHSGRWRCYHDHRSQRHCQGARRRRLLGP
ncbi:Signal transduction histidine kinase CheA EC 273 CDS [Bradyrhizobium sp.]|nr:chemotaxis protein CheA [Bradyrhizobium sp.]CUU14581.1 Signal transduction histidine kinase CheA EC 273 CDS [Bradyrhizobium sp.]